MDQMLLQGPLDCLKCQIWQETYAQKAAMMWEFHQDSTLKFRDGIEGFSMKRSAPAVRLSSANRTVKPCNGLRLVGLSECNVYDIPVMIAPYFQTMDQFCAQRL